MGGWYSRIAEPKFSSNKLTLSVNVEEEENSSDHKKMDSVDLMTPIDKKNSSRKTCSTINKG